MAKIRLQGKATASSFTGQTFISSRVVMTKVKIVGPSKSFSFKLSGNDFFKSCDGLSMIVGARKSFHFHL